ncbi:MAG: response regulator transcription factor [Thermoleophilia bacterium]|nr:response regulator transcription factor [Thermoleophilia bacterium]
MNAIVVEDDPRVRTSLERTLRANGYTVTAFAAGAPALAAVLATPPDVVVLDVNLPDLDGFEVCRQLRRRGDRTPVLMLTARDAVEDRVSGLDAGADDYLVKPFALTELLARLRALGRRSTSLVEEAEAPDLEYADLSLDSSSYTATRGARTFTLTRTEFLLLELFMRNPERVLSRETILDRVWGMDARTSTNGVEVYVGYLRRKMEAAGEARLLQTVRGFGYRLQDEP